MNKTTLHLGEEATNVALSGDWKKAILLNKTLLREAPKNLDAILRLGFAYLQTNNLKEAKKAYRAAISIQPSNQIAITNLEKIKILEKKGHKKLATTTKSSLDPSMFINIIGKTKVITLINIGQADILANLKVGQKINLNIKKRRVEARTEASEYIGALPDDISRRLIFFIRAKSVYTAYIKEASKNTVDIFVKEDKLGPKVKKYPSFPKNIQDDLKIMGTDEDTVESVEGSHGADEEPIDDSAEAPIDIDELADEVEIAEFYPGVASESDDEEEE